MHLNNVTRNLDVFLSCSELQVLLFNMCNMLELSGFFVCLGGGTEKNAGLWFARGDQCTHADTDGVFLVFYC